MKAFLTRAAQRGGFVIGLVVGLLIGLAVGARRRAVRDQGAESRSSTRCRRARRAGRGRGRAEPQLGSERAAGRQATRRRARRRRRRRPRRPPPAPATPPALAAPTVIDPAAPAAGRRRRRARPRAASGAGRRAPPRGARLAAAASTLAGADPFIYFVQAGAYSRTEDAEQQRAKLAMMGVESRLTEREQAGRTVYRVRVGPFEQQEDADSAKEKLGDRASNRHWSRFRSKRRARRALHCDRPPRPSNRSAMTTAPTRLLRRLLGAGARRRRCRRGARAGRRRSRASTTCASPQPVPAARRRQDRGDRVLLVRVPALQRLRAGARGLGQAAARRRRVPPRAGLVPRRAVRAQQRLYYTLEAIGLVPTLHRKVFDAIHSERTAPAHARGHRRVRAQERRRPDRSS